MLFLSKHFSNGNFAQGSRRCGIILSIRISPVSTTECFLSVQLNQLRNIFQIIHHHFRYDITSTVRIFVNFFLDIFLI